MSKHTPGPWGLGIRAARYLVPEPEATSLKAHGLNAEFLAVSIGTKTAQVALVPLDESNEANAKRIVECVNACEGIENPNVLPELLRALKQTRDALIRYAGPETSLYEITEANAAIARAEGRK